LGGRKGIRPVKTEWWSAGAAICLEQGADLHTAQPTPLPLTASCLSKIQIGLYILTAFLHLFRAFVSLADAIYEHNLKQAFLLVLKLLHLQYMHTHTHTHLFNGPCLGLPGSAGTRKVKPVWILLKQETVSGSGISWATCKSAPGSRQTTMPAPHHSSSTGRMPFLPPNQQRQSTESKSWQVRN